MPRHEAPLVCTRTRAQARGQSHLGPCRHPMAMVPAHRTSCLSPAMLCTAGGRWSCRPAWLVRLWPLCLRSCCDLAAPLQRPCRNQPMCRVPQLCSGAACISDLPAILDRLRTALAPRAAFQPRCRLCHVSRRHVAGSATVVSRLITAACRSSAARRLAWTAMHATCGAQRRCPGVARGPQRRRASQPDEAASGRARRLRSLRGQSLPPAAAPLNPGV